MFSLASLTEWVLGSILVLSSLGIIATRKPVYSSLSFLITLLALAALYLELSAQFIAVMQVLVYAGAILVIFMFVIVLFQDAHEQIEEFKPKSAKALLIFAASTFIIACLFLGIQWLNLPAAQEKLEVGYGDVRLLGLALYEDFFFPFEAVILLFLIAIIGSLYTARKVKSELK